MLMTMRWSDQRAVSTRPSASAPRSSTPGPGKTITDVGFATAAWVDWYSNSGLHSSVGVVPPDDFRTLHYAAINPEEQPTMEAAQNLG